MERYSRKSTLMKLVITVLLIVIATAAIIAGVLLYKGTFNNITYSNWLFYAAMAYIILGGASAYGAYMNTNNYSHKYVSSVMSADYETRKKIDDMLVNSSFSFMLKMIAIGIFLFVISAAADVLLK